MLALKPEERINLTENEIRIETTTEPQLLTTELSSETPSLPLFPPVLLDQAALTTDTRDHITVSFKLASDSAAGVVALDRALSPPVAIFQPTGLSVHSARSTGLLSETPVDSSREPSAERRKKGPLKKLFLDELSHTDSKMNLIANSPKKPDVSRSATPTPNHSSRPDLSRSGTRIKSISPSKQQSEAMHRSITEQLAESQRRAREEEALRLSAEADRKAKEDEIIRLAHLAAEAAALKRAKEMQQAEAARKAKEQQQLEALRIAKEQEQEALRKVLYSFLSLLLSLL